MEVLNLDEPRLAENGSLRPLPLAALWLTTAGNLEQMRRQANLSVPLRRDRHSEQFAAGATPATARRHHRPAVRVLQAEVVCHHPTEARQLRFKRGNPSPDSQNRDVRRAGEGANCGDKIE